jgi:hypothetical protein
MFRASIAPQAGNFDAIRGALVNLLAYSHEVYCKRETAHVEPLDVMDFIHKEMIRINVIRRGFRPNLSQRSIEQQDSRRELNLK